MHDRQLLLEMYRRMVVIRQFELASMELFKRGKVKGAVHPYIGQEASGVGVCMALRTDDPIAGTHRSHGHNLAKGADPDRMMAEILGKETGYCKGRGGSMHIAAFETGSLGALPVVGSGIPVAVGAALAFQMRGESRVAVPFTGEAGSSTGNWHEGMNMASVWGLPVVFVLENNQYGVSTHVSESVAVEDLSVRAASYGIPGVRVDGFDVVAVHEAASEAVERARNGGGPTLLVTECYRLEGHYAGEPEVYRDKAEVARYRKLDPIPRFHSWLVSSDVASEDEMDTLDASVNAQIEASVQFAKDSPAPEASTAMDFIYASHRFEYQAEGSGHVALADRDATSLGPTKPVMKPSLIVQVEDGVAATEMSYQEAIREGLREEMVRDERVFLMGEDIGIHGGAFGVTRTLHDQFGGVRVRNTPISENTIVGAATGAALVGMRPVIEIMFVDFSGLAMDQICNQAAKLRLMTGGQ